MDAKWTSISHPEWYMACELLEVYLLEEKDSKVRFIHFNGTIAKQILQYSHIIWNIMPFIGLLVSVYLIGESLTSG